MPISRSRRQVRVAPPKPAKVQPPQEEEPVAPKEEELVPPPHTQPEVSEKEVPVEREVPPAPEKPEKVEAEAPAEESTELSVKEEEVVEPPQPVLSGEYAGRLFGASKVKVLRSEDRMHNSRPMIHLVLADGTTALLSLAEVQSGLVE